MPIALFEKIAGQPNFYGNLADEELGRVVTPPAKANAPTSEEQKAARDNPGIRRSLAFFRLECAPKQSRNGTGPCVVWKIVNYWLRPTSPNVTGYGPGNQYGGPDQE